MERPSWVCESGSISFVVGKSVEACHMLPESNQKTMDASGVHTEPGDVMGLEHTEGLASPIDIAISVCFRCIPSSRKPEEPLAPRSPKESRLCSPGLLLRCSAASRSSSNRPTSCCWLASWPSSSLHFDVLASSSPACRPRQLKAIPLPFADS